VLKRFILATILATVAIALFVTIGTAGDDAKGTSIFVIAEAHTKLPEIELLLQSHFGDQVTRWTESMTVIDGSGQRSTEQKVFFEYPTNYQVGNALTRIVMGSNFVEPEHRADKQTDIFHGDSLLADNCLRLHDHWYYLGDYFEGCGPVGTSDVFNSFGSMNDRSASYHEFLISGGVDLYDNTFLSGYLGTLIDDTDVMPVGMRDASSSGRFYY